MRLHISRLNRDGDQVAAADWPLNEIMWLNELCPNSLAQISGQSPAYNVGS